MLLIAFHLICFNREETPLIKACYNGNYKIVKLLLENGADVNRQNDCRETPLFISCGEKLSIVKLLVEKKAKINLKNDSKVSFTINVL